MKVVGTYHFLGHQIKEHGVLPKNFMDAYQWFTFCWVTFGSFEKYGG